MKRFTLSTTLMGMISGVEPADESFQLKCRSGDDFSISIGKETRFELVKNLDGADRDRYPTPPNFSGSPSDLIRKYLTPNRLVAVRGVYQQDGDKIYFNARIIYLLQSQNGNFLFESQNWWLKQISRLADTWLGYIFEDKQTYAIDDFRLYQTNLNLTGAPFLNNIQECATLSRLIYGLSSAYLLTGNERFLSAAHAGVEYQREIFRCLSNDGRRCFWAFGKQKTDYGYRVINHSLNDDDKDTLPLYEQIYALAGLAQYYRITLDWEVLEDIERTIRAFNDFYLDRDSEYGENAFGDYFSHLDYVTMDWDSEALGDNKARKNWNSIGDHIPAYLVNLILAIEPLPVHAYSYEDLHTFINICKKILHTTSSIVLQKFPDPDPEVPFVNERFFRNWKPDHQWRWQQDRAVIGHNLKIAWNLTRVANYYYCQVERAESHKAAAEYKQFAQRLIKLADQLAIDMSEVGIDLFRSGVFDAVERHPEDGTFLEFPWSNTKDFWQQEQGILAYLILYGCTHTDRDQRQDYLQLARELEAFWNLFFLDQDNKGIFFRVTDTGDPVIQGDYGKKGTHSISGYHAFELNYLAHIYNSVYVTKHPFCLYFKPGTNCRRRSLNVLPDFFQPNVLEVTRITVDGIERSTLDRHNFRIELNEDEVQFGSEVEVVVEFTPVGAKDK
jgi:mannose/cellobiose epimerase-like protein (N-acyl-D-glucosamine 2-epimerase family)